MKIYRKWREMQMIPAQEESKPEMYALRSMKNHEAARK